MDLHGTIHHCITVGNIDPAALQAVWQVEDARPVVRELFKRRLRGAAGSRSQMHTLLGAHAQMLCQK